MEQDFENKTDEQTSKGDGSKSTLRLPVVREGSSSKFESLKELKLETTSAWRDFPLKLVFPLNRMDFKNIAPYSSFLELNKRNPHKRIPIAVAEQAKATADELLMKLGNDQTFLAEPIRDPFEGLTANLLGRLVFAESTGQVDKESGMGAQGLGQVLPETGEGMVKKYMKGETWEPFNPKMNLRATALFMSELLQTYRGDARIALAAYNHGPTKVNRLLKGMTFGSYSELEKLLPDGYATADRAGEYRPFDDTAEFVRKVMTGPKGEVSTFKLRLL